MCLNVFYRLIARRLSPQGAQARLSILAYHRVLPARDALFPNEVTRETFDTQMARLKAVFNVLPLSEAVLRLKNGSLPERAACITFDDGYADNVTIALPILQRHGLVATFFIATGYLDGGRMFNDTVIEAVRRAQTDRLDLNFIGMGAHDVRTPEDKAHTIHRILSQVKYLPLEERAEKVALLCEAARCGALPDDLMMTTAQLKTLSAAGMEIGAHTAHHPILARLDAGAVQQEILQGRQFLETALGKPVPLFAYPNGKPGADYLPEQVGMVRELGFSAALSTQKGAASLASDAFQLPRFTPWRLNINYYIPELLQNIWSDSRA